MDLEVTIIFENPDFVVFEKPSGLPVHGGPSVKGETLVDFLLERYPQIRSVGENPDRPGIVHRLDKDTSGLMVVAKTQSAFETLKSRFKNRQVEKKYLAICWGRFKNKEGQITSYIGRSMSNPLRQSSSQVPEKVRNAKKAITEYRVLEQSGEVALVLAKPRTGRMHQIRIHLHDIGHSIVGDQKYQTKKLKEKNQRFGRFFLHSCCLAFELEDGKEHKFESLMPDEFKKVIDKFVRQC